MSMSYTSDLVMCGKGVRFCIWPHELPTRCSRDRAYRLTGTGNLNGYPDGSIACEEGDMLSVDMRKLRKLNKHYVSIDVPCGSLVIYSRSMPTRFSKQAEQATCEVGFIWNENDSFTLPFTCVPINHMTNFAVAGRLFNFFVNRLDQWKMYLSKNDSHNGFVEYVSDAMIKKRKLSPVSENLHMFPYAETAARGRKDFSKFVFSRRDDTDLVSHMLRITSAYLRNKHDLTKLEEGVLNIVDLLKTERDDVSVKRDIVAILRKVHQDADEMRQFMVAYVNVLRHHLDNPNNTICLTHNIYTYIQELSFPTGPIEKTSTSDTIKNIRLCNSERTRSFFNKKQTDSEQSWDGKDTRCPYIPKQDTSPNTADEFSRVLFSPTACDTMNRIVFG